MLFLEMDNRFGDFFKWNNACFGNVLYMKDSFFLGLTFLPILVKKWFIKKLNGTQSILN